MNELSLAELASRSQEYEARGLPETARKFKRTYHLRMALPVATAVLSLLAVGVTGAIRARAWRVAAMVVAFGLYWATLALGELNTNLSPGVSVWAPNIVFSAMALVLLKMFPGRLPQPVE
jgi:lipopolysaccharide export LptBFGC system permease protein LptF